MAELDPPDLERCQAECKRPAPFRLGYVPKWERCENKPVYIAFENAPAADGLQGSMSMCEECAAEYKKRFGDNVVTMTRIKEVKREP